MLSEPAAAFRLAGFVDDRVEAGSAHGLAGAVEACALAELGEQVTGEDRPDAVDRLQRQASTVGAGKAAQLVSSGRSSLSTVPIRRSRQSTWGWG